MEQATINHQSSQPVAKPFQWRRVFIVTVLSAVFWWAQFWYQYYIYQPGVFQTAWVRSHALAGATLLAVTLGLSIIFKFKPSWAGQWPWRRNLGVAGFVLIFFHVAGVMRFYLAVDYLNPRPALHQLFFTLDPFVNPVLFGLPPFVILLAMAATSSDWAVRQLKRWWKILHRFIYLAEVSVVFHVILTGGQVMKSPPGYLLYGLGGLVIAGQIYWWLRISYARRFKNLGFYVGLSLIILILSLIVFYNSVYK